MHCSALLNTGVYPKFRGDGYEGDSNCNQKVIQIYAPNKFTHNKRMLFELTKKNTVKISMMEKSEYIDTDTIFSNHCKYSSDLVFMNNDRLNSIVFNYLLVISMIFFSTHQSSGDLLYSHSATRLSFEKPQPPNVQKIKDYPQCFKGA